MFRFHTIPQGQTVAVWDRTGRRTIVAGPARINTWHKRIEPLKSAVANPQEYLIVRHHDGRVEHFRGPTLEWLDPVEHTSISVATALPLSASEAIVIYRQLPGEVSRRILRGPALFVPEPDEWLHQFSWHGADPTHPTRKLPRALTFTKLRVIPDQMYFDVDGVRTADDALLVVQLMIFFELTDVAHMLDRTHDPVADFINAVTADVIDFAATRTFDRFKEQTEKLNVLETYPQLTRRAATIGYRIDKVVYRGYLANPKLQAMHDSAIETRTRLKLESETERQAQEIADLKLTREQERAARRQEMEQGEAQQKIRLAQITHNEQLRQKAADHDAQLRLRQSEHDAQLQLKQSEHTTELQLKQSEHDTELQRKQSEHDAAVRQRAADNDQQLRAKLAHQEADLRTAREREELNRDARLTRLKQRTDFLQSLRAAGVDLTQYLTARHTRPDRLVRIDSTGPNRPRMHLHERVQ